MGIDPLISWIARDLKRGGSAAQAAAVAVLVAGLLGSAGLAIAAPFDAALTLRAEAMDGMVRLTGPADLLRPDGPLQNPAARIDVTCGIGERQTYWISDRQRSILLHRAGLRACPAGQQALAVLQCKISLWELFKIRIFGGAGLHSPAARNGANHAS